MDLVLQLQSTCCVKISLTLQYKNIMIKNSDNKRQSLFESMVECKFGS